MWVYVCSVCVFVYLCGGICVQCLCVCICVFVYVCGVCVGICMMWRPFPLITTDGYSLCYRPPNATSPVRTKSTHYTIIHAICTWNIEERRFTSSANSIEALGFKT